MFHTGFVLAIVAAVISALLAFEMSAGVRALGLLWAMLFGLLNYDHRRDRVSILNGLKRRDNALAYTKLVDAMLSGLKRILSPADAATDPMPSKGQFNKFEWLMTPHARDPDDLKRLQSSTLSWPVMDAALKVALIYPLLLLLMQWAFTGQDTGIGAVTILVAEERTWLRAALVCPVVALVTTGILASASQLRVFEKAADWLFYLAVAVAGALAVALAVAVAVAVAVAFALCVGYGCAKGKGGGSYALFLIGVWACLVLAFALSAGGLESERRVFIFAIGLLPLINAVFDYLSYGFTLGLIRFGRAQRNVLTGLIWIVDGVIALLLLIGLGVGLSGTIALINYLAGQEFIALRPIYEDLKAADGRAGYTWLTLTLLSTLVPTLVHLVLVFLSAFTWVPQRFKYWIARGIEQNETSDLATLRGSIIAATLGALWAALVAYGFWGIWIFLTAYLEPAGLAVLGVVEFVALWLGWVEPGAA